MKKLLLVESSFKCKTIQAILGSEWQVEASFGHFTELAKDDEDSLGFRACLRSFAPPKSPLRKASLFQEWVRQNLSY